MYPVSRSLRRSNIAPTALFLVLGWMLSGGTAQANQIVNGNFSSGNTGFSSGYTYVPANGTVETGPGDYGLTTNPAMGFINGYASYGDHTGDAAALMLFVDGYYPGVNVWSEVVTVSPSTAYTFTGWVASAASANLADLGLFANGTQVGASFGAPSTAGIWSEWTTSFTTGAGQSQVTLSIQDLNTNPYASGDDFTLDDLALNQQAMAPEPSYLLATAPILLGLLILRHRRAVGCRA